MKWTEDQQRIIDARDCNLLVSAAAGSGKTAVLVERIIRMISDKDAPMNIDELLVVTFTKAAAAQMKDKITAAIEDMLKDEPENEHYLRQMNYINRANILTIDSFCYQIVKENFHILGIDPSIRIGETGEIGLLQGEILEQVMEEFYENREDFVEFSDAFSADKNDSNIEEYILKIDTISASYPEPEKWVEQARERLSVKSEEEFSKLLFVKRYFEELHHMAEGIKDTVLKALEQARGINGAPYMEKTLLSDIELLDDIMSAGTYSRFIELSERGFARLSKGKKGEYDEDTATAIKEARDDYKKQIKALFSAFYVPFDVLLTQMEKQRSMLLALLDIADEFRERFLQAKLDHNILEFSDVEHFALKVLCEGYDEEGEPIPSVIGREMSEDFREILIDEYQDSNYLQEAILKCVSKHHQGKHNIFMVGDVKQSIYSFRMARPDLFMEKYHTYSTEEGKPCRKLLLKNNFRSRANVLETINYIFYQIMGSELGGIDYTEDEALVPGRVFPERESANGIQVSDENGMLETECVEPDGTMDDTVELLLGESKNFLLLNADDEEMSSEKEENLNDELEDIGKIELEVSMVANRIQKLLGRDGGEPFLVTDNDSGTLRPVHLSDMVILFRAPAGSQQIFSEVLLNYNIPVKVQNETGYFDSVEVRMVLSLLRVIDNPHNDIELVSALRGYFGGLNQDELALVALVKRELENIEQAKEEEENNQEKEAEAQQTERKKKVKKIKEYYYKAVRLLAGYESDSAESIEQEYLSTIFQDSLSEHREYLIKVLIPKCARFVKLIEDLQERKSYAAMGQMLMDIYYHTGYYYFVEAMPEGAQRIRNLDLFLAETKRFEKGSYRTLFDFLRFVDKLKDKKIALGGDPAPESSEDVVRIMSIHRSKGLEFPVVFLAGTGKNFNRMDTKTPLIVHSDYYIGAKYVDVGKRCGNKTFIQKAFSSLMITESIAEELRVLYVGLTRAKEKLIITGVTPNVPALIKKYEMAAEKEEQRLPYRMIHSADNYLDLLVAAFMRNREFHEAMERVHKRQDKTDIVSAQYTQSVVLEKPSIRFRTEVYDFKTIVVQHLRSGLEKQVDRSQWLEEWKKAPAHMKEQLEERLAWKYADDNLTRLKSKLSVTEIKRIYEMDYEPSDVIEGARKEVEHYIPAVPYFVAGEQPLDAAGKGTWMHKTMELFDNAGVTTKEQVEKHLEALRQEGYLPKETEEFVTVDKVFAFADSNLGKRMCQAAKEGKLYKEKQFVIGVPAERLLAEGSSALQQTPIVVQGIIDAYFQEGDSLILLDYKTDKVKPGQEQMMIKRYYTQLLYYKDTLEQLTGLIVSETYLYSFALNKEIPVPMPEKTK